MNIIKLLVSGVILCGAVSTASVMAGDTEKKCDVKHHSGKMAEHDGFDRREFRQMGQALALTDAQKTILKSQRDADKSARDAFHLELKAARDALNTAVEAGANDAELAALTDTLGKLQAEKALTGAKKQQAFLALLTDDQKQKFAEMKAKRMEHKTARKQ